MNAIRNDSIEVLEMITVPTAPAHVISRLLAASEEHVSNVLMDPTLRAIWTRSGAQTTSAPRVTLDQGDVLLKELVKDHIIDVKIHLLERAHMCEIHVELRMEPTFEVSTFYRMGIDDIWETRLYAIADLLITT